MLGALVENRQNGWHNDGGGKFELLVHLGVNCLMNHSWKNSNLGDRVLISGNTDFVTVLAVSVLYYSEVLQWLGSLKYTVQYL